IHASTSEARQPIALALSRTDDGNEPARTSRQTVVRDKPVRARTSGQRRRRSPIVMAAATGKGTAGVVRAGMDRLQSARSPISARRPRSSTRRRGEVLAKLVLLRGTA